MIKHDEKGNKKRTITLLDGVLSWKAGKSMTVDQIIDVKEGMHTENFKKAPKSTVGSHCFSVFTRQRTLDLEAPTAKVTLITLIILIILIWHLFDEYCYCFI